MAKYIDGKELLREIIISKEKNELTAPTIEMFIKMANALAKALKFKYENDREDCIAFAIEDLLRYWRNFDPARSTNAFAYYSQITKNGLAKGFKKIRGEGSHYKVISINDDHGMMNI